MNVSGLVLIITLFLLMVLMILQVYKLLTIVDYQTGVIRSTKFYNKYHLFGKFVFWTQILIFIYIISNRTSIFIAIILCANIIFDIFNANIYKKEIKDFMTVEKTKQRAKITDVIKLISITISGISALVKVLKEI